MLIILYACLCCCSIGINLLFESKTCIRAKSIERYDVCRYDIVDKGERINVCVRGPQFVWLVGFQISVDTSILIPDQEFRDFLARRRRKFWIFRVYC